MLSYGAILRSERATAEEVSFIYQQMLGISTKKSYLAVASIQFLVDYLPKIESETFAQQVWPKLADISPWKGAEAKIEALWLLLEISNAFPSLPPKPYTLENFGRKKLLANQLTSEIANVLMVTNL